MKTIFVGGPYRGGDWVGGDLAGLHPDWDDYVAEVTSRITKAGGVALSHHLTEKTLDEKVSAATWEANDVVELDKCDALLEGPGPTALFVSSALKERARMEAQGKPVFRTIEEVEKWLAGEVETMALSEDR